MGEEEEVTSEQLLEILNAADSMHERLRDANSVKMKYKLAKSVITRTKTERDKLGRDLQVVKAELEMYKATSLPLSVKEDLEKKISELTGSYNDLINSSEIRYQSLGQELEEKHCKELETMRIEYEQKLQVKKCKSDGKVKACLEEEKQKNSALEKKLAALEERHRRTLQSQEEYRRNCDNNVKSEIEKNRKLEALMVELRKKVEVFDTQLQSVTKERDSLIDKLGNNSLPPIDDFEYITFGSKPTSELIPTTDEHFNLPLLQDGMEHSKQTTLVVPKVILTTDANIDLPLLSTPAEDSDNSDEVCRILEEMRFDTNMVSPMSVSPCRSVASVSPYRSVVSLPSCKSIVSASKPATGQPVKLKCRRLAKMRFDWRKRMVLNHRELARQVKKLQKLVTVGNIARSVKSRLLTDKQVNVRNEKEVAAVKTTEASTQASEEPKQPDSEETVPKKLTLLENLQKWRVNNYLSYPSAESDLEAPVLAPKKTVKKQKALRQLHYTSEEEEDELTDTIYTKSQGSVDSGYSKDSDSDSDVPLDKLVNIYKKQKFEDGRKVVNTLKMNDMGKKQNGEGKGLEGKQETKKNEEGKGKSENCKRVINLPVIKVENKEKKSNIIIHSVTVVKPPQKTQNALKPLEVSNHLRSVRTPEDSIQIVNNVDVQKTVQNNSVDVQKVQTLDESTNRDEDFLVGFSENSRVPKKRQDNKKLLDEIISILDRTPIKKNVKINSEEQIKSVAAASTFEVNSIDYSITDKKKLTTDTLIENRCSNSSILTSIASVAINETRKIISKDVLINKTTEDESKVFTDSKVKKTVNRKKKLLENTNRKTSPRIKMRKLSEDLSFSDPPEETENVSKITEIIISPKKLSSKQKYKIAKKLALNTMIKEHVEKTSFKRPNARKPFLSHNLKPQPPQKFETDTLSLRNAALIKESCIPLIENSIEDVNMESNETSFKRPNVKNRNIVKSSPQNLKTDFETTSSCSTTENCVPSIESNVLEDVTKIENEKTSHKRPNTRKPFVKSEPPQHLKTEFDTSTLKPLHNSELCSIPAQESCLSLNNILEDIVRVENEKSLDGYSSNEENEFESPASPEPDVDDMLVEPTIIPLSANNNSVPGKLDETILTKLLHFPKQKDVAACVLEYFTNKPPELTARIILKIVSQDIYSPVKVFNHRRAPFLSVTQQLMLGLLLALEEQDGGAVMDTFMKLAEQRILALQDAECINPVARVHAAVCKLKFEYNRMRIFLCKAFACMGGLALHYFYIVLTSWVELIPKRDALSGQGSVEVRTLVQLVRLRTSTSQHNLMLVLHSYHGYSHDQEDSAKLLEELCCYYLSAKRRDSLFCLIAALCQNIEESSVVQQLQRLKINFTLSRNGRNMCDIIKLIGCIKALYKSSSLSSIEQWIEQLTNDAQPEDIQSTSKYVLSLLAT